jgi:hypothetical protein
MPPLNSPPRLPKQPLRLDDGLRFAAKARTAGVVLRLERYTGLRQVHAGLLRAADFALGQVAGFLHERGC